MSLNVKRLMLGVLSAVFGIAVTAFVIYAYIPIPFNYHLGFGTTPEKFAYSNVILLFLSMSGLAAIWLDYFMQTDLLKR